jgi:O-antigen ligase
LQGIVAFIHYPQGYGVGKFINASLDALPYLPDASFLVSNAHNVILENIVSLGYWGLTYLIWIVLVIVDFFQKPHNQKGEVFAAIFLGLTAAMMFDVAYILPIFMWLWGFCLGIAQQKHFPNLTGLQMSSQ